MFKFVFICVLIWILGSYSFGEVGILSTMRTVDTLTHLHEHTHMIVVLCIRNDPYMGGIKLMKDQHLLHVVQIQ